MGRTLLIVSISLASIVAAAQEAPRNRTEVTVGGAYLRAKPGPQLKTANLGGWEFAATQYIGPRFGVTVGIRSYYGTADLTSLPGYISSTARSFPANPSVSAYTFLGGPQVRLFNRQRFHSSAIALFGVVDTNFDSQLQGTSAASVGLYGNQTVFATQLGGVLDYDLSARTAIRVGPGLVLTRLDNTYQRDISVGAGIVYRFGPK